MAFDPTTATLSFDPSTAQLAEEAPLRSTRNPAPSTAVADLEKMKMSNLQIYGGAAVDALNTGLDVINATGGGIATGLADMATYATSGKPSNLPVPDVVTEGMTAHPGFTLAGKATGMVAGTASLIAATKGAINPVTGAIGADMMGAGVVTDLAANTIAGSILAGPNNREFGAATGMVAAAAGNMIGMMGSKVSALTTAEKQTKDMVASVNSTIKGDAGTIAVKSQTNNWQINAAIEKQLFENFRNTPGAVKVDNIRTAASEFLTANTDELTPTQIKSVGNLFNNVSSAQTLADLHDARKIFAFDYTKFTEGRPLTQQATTQFHNLVNTISTTLEQNAIELGKGVEFKAANTFYQHTILPLINTGAKETADAVNQIKTDPLAVAKLADTLIDKFTTVAKAEQAKVFLDTLDDVGRHAVEVHVINRALTKATLDTGTVDLALFKNSLNEISTKIPTLFSPQNKQLIAGTSNVIKEATTMLGMNVDFSKMSPFTKMAMTGGALAAAGGSAVSGGGGMVAGGVAMGFAAGLIKLLNSPIGQHVIVESSKPQERALMKIIVKSILIDAALKHTTQSSQ